jgi:hypothetical protein
MPGATPKGIHYPLASEAPAGHSQMQTLATDVDNLILPNFPGTWTAYTPTILGSTTNPGMTVSGRYRLIGAKTVAFIAAVTVVTSLGSGTYSISCPPGLPGVGGLQTDTPIGIARYRSNAGAYTMGIVTAGGTSFGVLVTVPASPNPNMARWASTSPAGQINGDTWAFSGLYETA